MAARKTNGCERSNSKQLRNEEKNKNILSFMFAFNYKFFSKKVF